MAVKTSWSAGDVLAAADLTDTFAAKAPLASPALTGTPTVGGTAITALAGLQIVTPSSIANSGGTASASGGAVTFTGVSSVSLNGCFSSTYNNYRIIIGATWGTAGNQSLQMRARNGGTDITTASEYEQLLCYLESTTNPTKNFQQDTLWTLGTIGDKQSIIALDILNPFLAERTALNGLIFERSNTNIRLDILGGNRATAASHDGFTIYPSTSTMTGIVRVYGYRNS